jgi:hypothetical protein
MRQFCFLANKTCGAGIRFDFQPKYRLYFFAERYIYIGEGGSGALSYGGSCLVFPKVGEERAKNVSSYFIWACDILSVRNGPALMWQLASAAQPDRRRTSNVLSYLNAGHSQRDGQARDLYMQIVLLKAQVSMMQVTIFTSRVPHSRDCLRLSVQACASITTRLWKNFGAIRVETRERERERANLCRFSKLSLDFFVTGDDIYFVSNRDMHRDLAISTNILDTRRARVKKTQIKSLPWQLKPYFKGDRWRTAGHHRWALLSNNPESRLISMKSRAES